MDKILFFVYADKNYEMFVVPYIYFALVNNKDSKVEVVLENRDDFVCKNKVLLEKLDECFLNRYVLSQVPHLDDVIPNSIRFIVEPSLSAEYIYIGDIDLLVFDNVVDIHESLINQFHLPFSNVIRKTTTNTGFKKLSGLHFCKFDNYYPIPNIEDLDLSSMNDEAVLYEIMNRKGLMVDEDFKMRPQCGIHMSLNRDPIGRVKHGNSKLTTQKALGWGGREYYELFLKQISEKSFAQMIPFLDLNFRFLLNILESIATDQFRSLQLASMTYIDDRRFSLSEDTEDLKAILDKRSDFIKSRQFKKAEHLGYKAISLWPKNIDLWHKHGWLMLVMSKFDKAAECFKVIASLDGGLDFLSNSNIFLDNIDYIRKLGKEERELVNLVKKSNPIYNK